MNNIDIKHIAELSRIKLSNKELKKFPSQMEQILNSVKVLTEVDTKDIQPMKKHISFLDLRKDIPKESMKKEDILSNVKHIENGLVKVYGRVFEEIEES